MVGTPSSRACGHGNGRSDRARYRAALSLPRAPAAADLHDVAVSRHEGEPRVPLHQPAVLQGAQHLHRHLLARPRPRPALPVPHHALPQQPVLCGGGDARGWL